MEGRREGRRDKEDDCTGTFWEARYKSIANLDEEALLATCASIDQNPVAAGIATTPESSHHTSIKQWVDHARAVQGDLEQAHWLCPLLHEGKGHHGR